MGINLSGTGKVAAIWLILAYFSYMWRAEFIASRTFCSNKLFQQNCWFMMAFVLATASSEFIASI
jgi:POT family proton-dependent oligopeptide transporter